MKVKIIKCNPINWYNNKIGLIMKSIMTQLKGKTNSKQLSIKDLSFILFDKLKK